MSKENIKATILPGGGIPPLMDDTGNFTRKRSEAMHQARLHILETASQADTSMDGTLRLILDQMEALTGSSISFYHFLEEDQQTLSMQNWSTNTLRFLCTAEGKGRHYPVAEAGIWADCVRKRQPVIHNDYASLANRKGLPEGHAPVVRELVVPIFRGTQIKAIVGVGNKQAPYDDTDLETLSQLADLSWEIVNRKMAEEECRIHLRFLKNMDRINLAIQGADTLEQMLGDVLSVLLDIFDCDRAVLLYPCDPDAAKWHVLMERAMTEYPGAPALGMEVPMDRDVRQVFAALLASEVPVGFGPGNEEPLPAKVAELFSGHSQLSMAVQPKVNQPYMLGLHQCTRARTWTREERGFLRETGRRMVDSLTSLLVLRELKNSEKRFRALVDQAADPFFVHNLEGHFLDVNRRGCESLGYAREELLAMNVADVDAEFVSKNHVKKFWRELSPDQPVTVEGLHKRKDGTTFPVEVRLVRLEFEEHGAVLALVRDISERFRIERSLRESEERFRLLVELSPDLIFIRHQEKILYANPAAARMVGADTAEELIGRSVLDFARPERHEFLKKFMADNDNKPSGSTVSYEGLLVRLDGSQLPIELTAVRFQYQGMQCSQQIMRDISDRKRMESALRESERMFRRLAENSPDNIARYGLDCRRRYVNPTLEKSLGRPAQAILGCTPTETGIIDESRRYEDKIAQVAATGNEAEIDLQLPDIGNGTRYHNVRFVAERDADGAITGVLAIGRDVTERRRAEVERNVNLRFFEAMDRINQAIQRADDLEQMMRAALDEVLELFAADRAYLLYPCDPEIESWSIPMECTRPEYSGACAEGKPIPHDSGMAAKLRRLLATQGPVKFGPATENPLPVETSKRYGIQSLLGMAIYPKHGKPWQFGIHQCSSARQWTTAEEQLFEAIGNRLADTLSSLLLYRDLRESETRYRTIVETTNEGIVMLDQDERTTFVNSCLAEMLGYTSQEMLGRPATDFIFEMDSDDYQNKLANRRRGMGAHYQRRLRHKDGSPVWTRISSTPFFDDDRTYRGAIIMFTDISEQKKAEEKLNIERQRLSKMTADLSLAEERERLRIAAVLHDHVGQLLLSAQIKLDALMESQNIPVETRQALCDTRDLLDRTGRDVHSLTLQLSPPILSVAGLEAALQWLCRQMENDFALQVEFEDDEQPKSLSRELDAVVYQCARELLVNVAKHADTKRAWIRVKREDEEFCLVVEDRGVGFDPAVTHSEQREKWRFGLFSIRTRIERLGGKMSIIAAPDRGCLVAIQLPILKQEQGASI